MERRALGRTGLTVSAIGFGAAPLGDIWGAVDERDATAAVHAAIDAGIDYFDVAPLYGFGLAEQRLGAALRGKRDRVVLATKCCRDGFHEFDFSGPRVAASVEESLRRLDTDRIDVLQIHDVEFGTLQQVLDEALPAARRLQQQGKVRFVGISGLPVRYLRKLAERADLDTLLSWGHLNLVEDELVEELVPLARERGFALLSASPLLQGLLSDQGPPAWHRSPKPVIDGAKLLAAACRRHGTDLATVAIAHAVQCPHVATTLIGMKSRAEVESNVRAAATPISPTLAAELATIAKPFLNMMWFEGRPENNLPPRAPNRHVPQTPDVSHS